LAVGHVRGRVACNQVADVVKERVRAVLGHARVLGASIADPTLLETGEAASR
jgi:hypothetical protein